MTFHIRYKGKFLLLYKYDSSNLVDDFKVLRVLLGLEQIIYVWLGIMNQHKWY